MFNSKVRDKQSNVWAMIDVDIADDDDDDDDDMMGDTGINAFATTAITTTTITTTSNNDRRFMSTYIKRHANDNDVLMQALQSIDHHNDDDTYDEMTYNPFLSPNKITTTTSVPTTTYHHRDDYKDNANHDRRRAVSSSGYLSLKQSMLIDPSAMVTVLRAMHPHEDEDKDGDVGDKKVGLVSGDIDMHTCTHDGSYSGGN